MSDSNIHTELDADGVLLARIDMPKRAMNVFSASLMDSLEKLISRAESDSTVRSVVLTSAKTTFLAGADLEMIQMFTERARAGSARDLRELFGRLGRLFRRLELSPKPFVAAINGLALGGGLEVCLACRERVVANDPDLQLGLPEVKLGLLPGAGGTQRLPRLVGAAKGLKMLLSGDPVSPREALALGLVDEIAPAESLLVAARRRALAISRREAPWDASGATFDSTPFDFSKPTVFTEIAAATGVSDYQMDHYPAYKAIMACVAGGWNQPMTDAGEHEMAIFVELMRDPVAGNMVRSLFLNRQKAAKQGLLAPDSVLAQGEGALLPRLRATRAEAEATRRSEPDILLAVALEAARAWGEGRVDRPELADVAVVAAGLFPSYTGGPYSYLRQAGLEALRTRARWIAGQDEKLFVIPDALERFLQPDAAVAA